MGGELGKGGKISITNQKIDTCRAEVYFGKS